MTNNKMILILVAILLVSGCRAMMAPQYQPDFELVNELIDMNLPSMKSGEFSDTDDSLNRISIRGSAMVSPYGNSYAEYLKKALEEELKQSELWDQSSKIVISGTLVKNELGRSGIYGWEFEFYISAIFIVTKDGSEIYNKSHTIHHEWEVESSLGGALTFGALEFPEIQPNYVISIRKLLRDFFLDKELLITLKR